MPIGVILLLQLRIGGLASCRVAGHGGFRLGRAAVRRLEATATRDPVAAVRRLEATATRDPVAALRGWLDAAGIRDGWVP